MKRGPVGIEDAMRNLAEDADAARMAKADIPEPMLSLNQAAAVLGVVPGTLAKWVRRGAVRGYKTPGGRWRFASDDLRAFVSEVK